MNDNIIINEVKLIKATHGGKKVWDNRTKRYIVNPDEIVTALTLAELTNDDYKLIESAYADTIPNFIPKWFKEQSGFMNLTTAFAIPVMDIDGTIYDDITTLINECPTLIGSTISISLDLKKGSVYPKSIKIVEQGEEKNPFEGM